MDVAGGVHSGVSSRISGWVSSGVFIRVSNRVGVETRGT